MPSTLPSQIVDRPLLEDVILPNVFKPARYIGMEQGAYRKPFEKAKATFCMAFPDIYEIGISNYGVKLFYSLINNHPDYMADRVYAPAPDMRAKLKEHDFPLYGVESMQPLKNFDVLAFTLQYELNYTTILGMLEAAQIPLRTTERADDHYPLLIAGGPGSANPMPLSPFFDAFILGDGEEILIEIMDTTAEARQKRWTKTQLIDRLAKISGIFIPGKTPSARKRIVDIAQHPVEIAPLTPIIQAVHDRVTIEARRGCDRMCRFCQPCFINLPVREQNIETIKKQALKEIAKTGYEECSLLSLSIADYSYFKPLVLEVAEALEEEGVSLSLPSQRADRFSLDVAEAVQSVRKSTLTFAPEAGTLRLRDVINKNLTDAEIQNAVTTAYQSGWNKVKLYFIIGLPTETLDDLDGIVDTIKRLQDVCNEIKRDEKLSIRKFLEVNVTLSNFVPKPHTPFQWFAQDSMDTLYAKRKYLKEKFFGLKGVKLNFTDPEISKLEAVISKGGEELADVIERVYKDGAYLDAWDDMLNFKRWFEALKASGIDPEQYTRERCVNPDDVLPWDPIDMGLSKQWLKDEYEKAKAAGPTVPCFEACSTCGVCASYGVWPTFTDTKALEEIEKRQNEKREREKQRQKEAQIALENAQNTPKNDEKTPIFAQKTGKKAQKSTKNRVNSTSQSDSALPETHKLKKEAVCKSRILIEKRGKLRFMSHLDWLRMIHRAVVRSGLPAAYSQGFNPHLKVSFGPALPLFTESFGEYVDIELSRPITDVCSRLNPHLPEGGQALAESIVPIGVKSIDSCIKTLTYAATYTGQTTCTDPVSGYTIGDRVKTLSEQAVIPLEPDETKKTRHQLRNKLLNLKPYLADLRVEGDRTVHFRLNWLRDTAGDGQNQQPHSIKPSWLLGLIQPDAADGNQWTLIRTHIELA